MVGEGATHQLHNDLEGHILANAVFPKYESDSCLHCNVYALTRPTETHLECRCEYGVKRWSSMNASKLSHSAAQAILKAYPSDNALQVKFASHHMTSWRVVVLRGSVLSAHRERLETWRGSGLVEARAGPSLLEWSLWFTRTGGLIAVNNEALLGCDTVYTTTQSRPFYMHSFYNSLKSLRKPIQSHKPEFVRGQNQLDTRVEVMDAPTNGVEDNRGLTNRTKGARKRRVGRPRAQKPVNVDVQCAVQLVDGRRCARSLTCKRHGMSAKRAVPGRSAPFDQLVVEIEQRHGQLQQ